MADDIDERLSELAEVTVEVAGLHARQEMLVAGARAAGATWADIAAALGVSVQAAHKRYRRLRHDADTGAVWHEPPLPM